MKTLLKLVIAAIILLGCGVLFYMNPALRSKVGNIFSSTEEGKKTGPEARKAESPIPAPTGTAGGAENFLTPGIRQFVQSNGATGDKYRAIASQLEQARRAKPTPENETQLVDLAVSKMEEIKAISEAYIAANQFSQVPGPEARNAQSPAAKPVSVTDVVENFLTPGLRQFAQSRGVASDKYRAVASQLEQARREKRTPENETQIVDLAVGKMEAIKAISLAYIAANHISPPTGLRTNDVGFSHATLLWDTPPVPGISYEIWDGPPAVANSKKLAATSDTPCRIEGSLRPDTAYVFYVRAAYAGNYSETTSITIKTKPVTLEPPANLRVMEADSDSITLRWDAAPLGASYEILDKPPPDSASPKRTQQDTTALMNGLQPDTEYTYYIRTIWDDKVSKAASIRAKTKPLLPPDGVAVAETGMDFVTLKWNAASPAPDVSYEVSITGASVENKTTTRDTTARFERLKPDAEFTLSIRTVNKSNAGSQRVSIKAKTKTYRDMIIGKWTYRWPGNNYDTTIVFNPDGTFTAEWVNQVGAFGMQASASGTWTIQDGLLAITGKTRRALPTGASVEYGPNSFFGITKFTSVSNQRIVSEVTSDPQHRDGGQVIFGQVIFTRIR